MNCITPSSCREHLNKMAERYDVNVIWVLGYTSNCRANELTRNGTAIELSDEFLTIGVLQAHD